MPTLRGLHSWSMDRDAEGHREYRAQFLIKALTTDGPANILQTPGLPLPGDVWSILGDIDIWAWCRPDASVTIHQEKAGDPNRYWLVEQTFSTKPPDLTQQRPQDNPVEDPLLEPAKVSGSFTKEKIHGLLDIWGRPLANSAHELIQGPENEWDVSRPTIRIEQNVATPTQAYVLPSLMMDRVNTAPLWGLPRRTIKLSNATFELRYYASSSIYYTRHLEFEINYNTFDKEALDEGNKVLQGKWNEERLWELTPINGADPDPSNPQHFMRAIDYQGNYMKVVLDGQGKPYVPESTTLGRFYDAGENELLDVPALEIGDPAAPSAPTGLTATLKSGGNLGPDPDTYLYIVSAVNDAGESIPSGQVSAVTTTTQKAVQLEWTGVTGAIRYRVYRSQPSHPLLPGFRLIGQTPAKRPGSPGTRQLVYYKEANFLLLGIPLIF